MTNLSRFIVASLAALLFIGAAATGQAQQKSRLSQILERNTLRVGTTGDFNPLSIRDPATGGYRGFEIDAAEQLAKDLGVKLDIVPTDWVNLVAGIVSDRYDIFMGGSTMNTGRLKTVAFTIPYLETATVPLFDKKDAGRFKSWADLDKPGVTVAVILGTVFEDQAKQHFKQATIKRVQPPATSYQEVLAGRADAALTSSIDVRALVARHPHLDHLALDTARNKRPYGYIIAQGDTAWAQYLNNWITLKLAEGFFASLEAKWLK